MMTANAISFTVFTRIYSNERDDVYEALFGMICHDVDNDTEVVALLVR